MFAPDQERAAAELLRVVRPGGRIGLANWTPEGFIGGLFRVVSEFVPPPAGLKSPMAWGMETRLVELFGPQASDLRVERKLYPFRFGSAEHFIEYFRTYYGPTYKAFAALDEVGQKGLHDALRIFLNGLNIGRDGTLVIPGEYLEVVVTK
jgi:hypothetical protein